MQKKSEIRQCIFIQNIIIHHPFTWLERTCTSQPKPARTLFRDFVFIALIDFIDFCAIVFSWMNTNLVKLWWKTFQCHQKLASNSAIMGTMQRKLLKEKMEIILVSILTNTSSNKLTSVYLMFHLTVFLWSK